MNLNNIAFFNGKVTVYWSGIVIALGIIAGFCLIYSLYSSHNRNSGAVFVFLPIAVVLSVIFCRAIHWYTHIEQYESFFKAMTDYSGGSYYLQGSLLGVFLAAVIVKSMNLVDDRGELMDAIAPGYALTIALIRLSCLFNNSDRGKMAITRKFFQRLPIGASISDASGNITDWRFATFFFQFLLMMVLCLLLVRFYILSHNRSVKEPCERTGNVYKLFIVWFGAIELVLDSTRYDASHMHFSFFLKFLNKFTSFISLAQLIAAISMLCILIHYTKMSIRANGKMGRRTLVWFMWGLGLAMAGASEYLVQRFSSLYLPLYLAQSVGCVLMSVAVYMMYATCTERE